MPPRAFPIMLDAPNPMTKPETVLIEAAITGFWLRNEMTKAMTITEPAILTRLFIDFAVYSEESTTKLYARPATNSIAK